MSDLQLPDGRKLDTVGEFYLTCGGVKPAEVEECVEWAFGGLDANMKLNDLKNEWNNRHSSVFVIEGHEPIWLALTAIGKAFTQRELGFHDGFNRPDDKQDIVAP